MLSSVVLTWSPPQEPNGVIIAYQVTYRIGDSRLVSVNTTDTTFTISLMVRDTNLSTISIRPYTSVGPGAIRRAELLTAFDLREFI